MFACTTPACNDFAQAIHVPASPIFNWNGKTATAKAEPPLDAKFGQASRTPVCEGLRMNFGFYFLCKQNGQGISDGKILDWEVNYPTITKLILWREKRKCRSRLIMVWMA